MNKINETNVVVSKDDYKQDQQIAKTAAKNKDELVLVDKNKIDKMAKDKATSTSSPTMTSTSPTTSTIGMTENEVVSDAVNDAPNDAVIQPKDQETIKYLSNVKHHDTGELSKPFSIGGKNYQMIRGVKPNREIVLAVMSLDETDEMGSRKIHTVDHFDKNIASPMKRSLEEKEQSSNNDNEKFVDRLNLSDGNGFNHFFVNKKTGDITNKFKSTKDMVKSGVSLGLDEDYMDAKTLKRFRYGNYFKNDINEVDGEDTQGTDVNKLKADVKKLSELISAKFSRAIAKIDKPIEQVEFLTQMAEMIGVPFNKLTSLINNFKNVAKQQNVVKMTPSTETPQQQMAAESKVIKKDALLESLGVKQTIIKVNKQ